MNKQALVLPWPWQCGHTLYKPCVSSSSEADARRTPVPQGGEWDTSTRSSLKPPCTSQPHVFPHEKSPLASGGAGSLCDKHPTAALDRRAPHLLLPPHCSSAFAPPLSPPHSCLSNLHICLLCPHQLLLTSSATTVQPPPASPCPFKYCFPPLLPRADLVSELGTVRPQEASKLSMLLP